MAGPNHPFYLTDSIVGGGSYSSFQGETLYGGGDEVAGEGGRAELAVSWHAWLPKEAPNLEGPQPIALRPAARARGACQLPCAAELRLSCPLAPHVAPSLPAGTQDQPYVLTWTPDDSTPDSLYYQ
jgi:hypothetical protein